MSVKFNEWLRLRWSKPSRLRNWQNIVTDYRLLEYPLSIFYRAKIPLCPSQLLPISDSSPILSLINLSSATSTSFLGPPFCEGFFKHHWEQIWNNLNFKQQQFENKFAVVFYRGAWMCGLQKVFSNKNTFWTFWKHFFSRCERVSISLSVMLWKYLFKLEIWLTQWPQNLWEDT